MYCITIVLKCNERSLKSRYTELIYKKFFRGKIFVFLPGTQKGSKNNGKR